MWYFRIIQWKKVDSVGNNQNAIQNLTFLENIKNTNTHHKEEEKLQQKQKTSLKIGPKSYKQTLHGIVEHNLKLLTQFKSVL
jgi:hypothetical protein